MTSVHCPPSLFLRYFSSRAPAPTKNSINNIDFDPIPRLNTTNHWFERQPYLRGNEETSEQANDTALFPKLPSPLTFRLCKRSTGNRRGGRYFFVTSRAAASKTFAVEFRRGDRRCQTGRGICAVDRDNELKFSKLFLAVWSKSWLECGWGRSVDGAVEHVYSTR